LWVTLFFFGSSTFARLTPATYLIRLGTYCHAPTSVAPSTRHSGWVYFNIKHILSQRIFQLLRFDSGWSLVLIKPAKKFSPYLPATFTKGVSCIRIVLLREGISVKKVCNNLKSSTCAHSYNLRIMQPNSTDYIFAIQNKSSSIIPALLFYCLRYESK
jgi:hypothetical protein